MNPLDDLKNILNLQNHKKRNMKRVFQWRRFVEWEDLSTKEKLTSKRILLIPIFAYLIIGIIDQNLFLIVLSLIVYILYKRFQKGNIKK
tara:strand:- start:487 stop:753 length:267 start_codon:yes stop_codon:yes gene_type:complete